MSVPCELSLSEIRNFMLIKGGKVTNHELVKYFKKFLTNPNTQAEARKQFKTYVNILSTIKNEGKDKYLILRKKYINECPAEDNLSLLSLSQSDFANSPGSRSTISEHDSSVVGTSLSSQFGAPDSPFREPPPYKPPPEVKIPGLASETKEQYKDCVDEFKYALSSFGIGQSEDDKQSVEVVKDVIENSPPPPVLPPRKRSNAEKINEQVSDEKAEENKENASIETSSKSSSRSNTLEKQISVAEATKKFNRIASEEEAKVTSPPTKKKPEKRTEEISNEILISSHPKSKEWLVSSAKANYQELAKLASEYPELTKLHDLTTGYTALHWAAKHGNEDVVKLIAGTHRADVNSRTNGGYTPLHLAMQFGKDNIFELLCNVYKADRDILDWSGRKPLDYRKIHTTVSASTYSSEYNLPYSNHSTTTMPSPKFNYGTLNKSKRHKRAVSSTGLVHRTQSMLGISQQQPSSPSNSIASTNNNPPPNRSTYFSPELGDGGARQQKKYQSFSFRKKFGTIGRKFDRYDKDSESTA